MLDPLQNAELFLINAFFQLYLFILVIRFVLCWTRADYFNPVTQFVVKFTQPIIKPLRRFIPTISYIEIATLVVIVLLAAIKYFLIGLITFGAPKNPAGLFILGSAEALKLLVNLFFYAILIQSLLSWVQMGYSPVANLLAQITAPIMRPMQRLVPQTGGFDLSPIPALILLQLLLILFVEPLLRFGVGITFS